MEIHLNPGEDTVAIQLSTDGKLYITIWHNSSEQVREVDLAELLDGIKFLQKHDG